jgi:hypothetical protein
MRLAELIGTLSLAEDAGTGLPDFHALRGATLAVGLAREAKADERTVHDAFYLPLLAMSGTRSRLAVSRTGAIGATRVRCSPSCCGSCAAGAARSGDSSPSRAP